MAKTHHRWLDQKTICIGPGSSTSTLPSAAVTMPRRNVSWRRPVPSARLAKIYSPVGFVPCESQPDSKNSVCVCELKIGPPKILHPVPSMALLLHL